MRLVIRENNRTRNKVKKVDNPWKSASASLRPRAADVASLLLRLDETRGHFGKGSARETAHVLNFAKSATFLDPEDLIQFHEAVLYLRAYPQDAHVLGLVDEILFDFERRLRDLDPHADRAAFEYENVSGIAGTGLTTNFSYSFARSLAERHNESISVDWNQYKHADRLASTLAMKIPAAREDWAIAPHPDWRRWYESAGGNLAWLLDGVTPEVYDLLEIPLRWELRDSAATLSANSPSDASRSRLRAPRRSIFYHDGPFLTRKDISLEAELAGPPIKVFRVPAQAAQIMLGIIIDASAVRYRELYGFLYPDMNNVFHADLGRGVDLYFFGVPRKWQLPTREYCAGMYFKNGVPIGYVEVMWQDKRMEVGFNLYYTFRKGETAWLYARLLKLFHHQYGAATFFIDPYQLGHENDEAIDSGAFWFYHKLGFRSESSEIEKLVAREERKIAANPQYRTTPRTLRRLAAKPVAYSVAAPKREKTVG